MKPWKDTLNIIKFNLRNIVLFELFFRLVTGTLFVEAVEFGLRFSLKQAGYSYLTVNNFGLFIIHPWTVVVIVCIFILGMVFLWIEVGALITVYQGSLYWQHVNPIKMLWGGLRRVKDGLIWHNRLLPIIILINTGLVNVYYIYRFLIRIKSLDFMMSSIWGEPFFRVLLLLFLIAAIAVTIPCIFIVYATMVEQKNFRDGFRRSMQLLKGNWHRTILTLLIYNGVLILLFMIIYAVIAVITAIAVLLFSDRTLALAVMLTSCDKIELVLIFIASIIAPIINYSASTVMYYQYSNALDHLPVPDFELPNKHKLTPRTVAIISGIAVLFSLIYILDTVRNGSILTEKALAPTLITAHRGSSQKAPENTLPALETAALELADYAEIDVQITADNVIVLFHDNTLKRLTGINRQIRNMNYKEVSELDVGKWFSSEYINTPIPRFDEVLEYCKGKINLNIELKNLGKESELPEAVAEMIEIYDFEQQCVITSTSLGYLSRVKEQNPNIKTGYILSAAYGNYFHNENVDFISIRSSFVTASMVNTAHNAGKEVHAWTVNTKSEMERMILLGVDNIITDRPLLAKEIVLREGAADTLFDYIKLVLK